jgi:hypothetical protein
MIRIRSFFIGSLLLLQVTNVIGQKTNDLWEENLNGKIKSIKEITYSVTKSNGKIIKNDLLISKTSLYNIKGFKMEESIYKPDSSWNVKSKYYHDKNGYLTEEINFYPNPSYGPNTIRRIYQIDSHGKKIEEKCYDEEGMIGNTISTYDKNGLLIEETDYFYGFLNKKTFYIYVHNGKIIAVNHFNPKGKFQKKVIYKFDKFGNRIIMKEYNSDEKLNNSFTFKYKLDKMNNWINRIEYKNKQITTIIEKQIEYY